MNDSRDPPRDLPKHIKLTSHPDRRNKAVSIDWGASNASLRGPVVGTLTGQRNAVGAHSGSYSMYRALAVAAGDLDPVHIPDLTDTAPAEPIGPHPQWSDAKAIVSLDPYGHMVSEAFEDKLEQGWDIRPTIAVTKARVNMPEIHAAMGASRLRPDGNVLTEAGDVRVTKAAIEPVWYLPGIAERLGVAESELRRCLFEHSGSMFTELVTRSDLKLFLPPIGGSPPTSSATSPPSATPKARLPVASMTSATAPTCSAPTSARVVPISPMGSRSASRWPSPVDAASSSTTARRGGRSER